MVNSAFAHRKLRKVLARNVDLPITLGDIDPPGFDPTGLEPTDIIGGFLPTGFDGEHPSSSTISSRTALPSPIIPSVTLVTPSSPSIPATSLSSSIPATSSSSSIPATSSPSTTAAVVASASESSQSSTSSLIISSTSASSAASSSKAEPGTAGSSKSGSSTIGAVLAVLITIIALAVFGFFIWRQRRKRRNATQQLLTVEPFRLGVPAEKELPPPPMSEQRMTFGALYGKPSPEYGPTQYHQSYPSAVSNSYLTSPITESPFSDAAALSDDESHPAVTSGRNLTSPFVDPPMSPDVDHRPAPISPFADPIIRALPAVAANHTPSYTANGGNAEALTRMPGSSYSPPAMQTNFGNSTSPSASPAANVAVMNGEANQRPVTVYDENDAYAGI